MRRTEDHNWTKEHDMADQPFDNEKFTDEIRKFLKKVGITSQIDIENAVRTALAEGKLDTAKPLQAVMVLEIPELGLKHRIDHAIAMR
jgi:basic membrane lipoprotein Med (substrate-binding protein (PBP1-ABC) superfamily)